jgi:hypothetical protein
VGWGHEGVETEWQTAAILSAYNTIIDGTDRDNRTEAHKTNTHIIYYIYVLYTCKAHQPTNKQTNK